MSLPASEERKGPEDEVAGDSIGGNDNGAFLCRVLDEDLEVGKTCQSCDELGLGKALVDPRVPSCIGKPPAREDGNSPL